MSQTSLRPRASLLNYVQTSTGNGTTPTTTPNKPKTPTRASNGSAKASASGYWDKDVINELITMKSDRIAYDFSGLNGVNNFRNVVLDGTVTHFMRCFSCKDSITMLKDRGGHRVADYLRHNKRKGHSNDDDCNDDPEAKVDVNANFKTKAPVDANGTAKDDNISSDEDSGSSESDDDESLEDKKPEVLTKIEDKKPEIKKKAVTPTVTSSPRQFMLRTKPLPKQTPQAVAKSAKPTPIKRKVSFSAKVDEKIDDVDIKELQIKKLKAEIAESQAKAEHEKILQAETQKNFEILRSDNAKFFNEINANLREIISGIAVLTSKLGQNGPSKVAEAKPVVVDVTPSASSAAEMSAPPPAN